MFAHLNVESLNLTNFNTSNVKNMAAMFHHCYRLASIDLTSFDMSNVEIVNELNETDTNKVGMFSDSNNLTTIYVSNSPELSKVSDSTNMFKGSFLLKGGAGTRYDSNHLDATYARIDDPDNGNPGYFTYKEPTT